MKGSGHLPPFYRSICTKVHQSGLSSSENKCIIVESLISAFTGRTSIPPAITQELTTEVVESVLQRFKNWRLAYNFFQWASTQHGYHHNCYTYNVMASILSGAQQDAHLKAMALDMLDSRCSLTSGALGFLIRCLGNVGLVEDANVIFDKVRLMGLCVPNSYSYNCLLEAISKTSLVDLAERRLKEMRELGWEVNKYTLTPLLKVYCNAGEFDKALSLFNHIHEKGWLDLHILSVLVLSFSMRGKVDDAFELIEWMEGRNFSLNEKTFHVLIHGFVSASRVDKAFHLFQKMCRHGFAPDVGIYDILIRGFCERNEFDKALSLFSDMKSSGISPDVRLLTSLVMFSSEEQAIQLFQEAKKYLGNESLPMFCDSVLHGLVIKGLIDRAYHLFNIMREDLLSAEGTVLTRGASFHILISGLYKCGKLDEALDLFKGMEKFPCKKDVPLYNNLILALSNSDRVEDCLDLLKEMKHHHVQPTHFTYNSIYGYYCRKSDAVAALDLVKEMCLYGHEPWIKHTTLLIKNLCSRGRASEGCAFLADMVKEGVCPDPASYSAALKGLLTLRRADDAIKLFQNMRTHGNKPDVVAYNILINGLCKADRFLEAENVFIEMREIGLFPSIISYNSLIDGCCKNGDIDKALSYLSNMGEIKPNIVTYTILVDGLSNAGRPDDAIMVWDEMQRKGCSANRIALMALINGLCKNGRPTTALGYLRQMNEKGLCADSYVYIALLDAFLDVENSSLAFEVLKEMVDKGITPNLEEKNRSHLGAAILKLYKDPQTSSNVHSLLESGAIPTVGVILQLNPQDGSLD